MNSETAPMMVSARLEQVPTGTADSARDNAPQRSTQAPDASSSNVRPAADIMPFPLSLSTDRTRSYYLRL